MTQPNKTVKVGSVEIGNDRKLSIIAGPCALESRGHALEMASALKEIAAKAGVGLIYKTSFDKANRTSANAERGMGFELAHRSSRRFARASVCRSLTDVHEREQCAPSPKRSTCCKSRPSFAGRPICWLLRRKPDAWSM